MKKITILFALLFTVTFAFAQQGSIEVTANGQFQFTKGKDFITDYAGLHEKFETGFGANIEFAYYLQDNLSVGLEGGFNIVETFEMEQAEYKPKVFSLLVKPRFYFMDGSIRPFVDAGVGLAFMKMDIEGTVPTGAPADLDNETKFQFAPAAGVRFGLSEKFDINAGLRYNIIKDFNYLQAFAGISFKL